MGLDNTQPDQTQTQTPAQSPDDTFVDNPNYQAPLANSGANPSTSGQSSDDTFVDNPNYKAPHQDQMTMQDTDTGNTKTAKAAGGLFEGVGEGAFSTLSGVYDIARKAEAITDKIAQHMGLGLNAADQAKKEKIQQSVSDELHNLSGENEQRSNAATVGYGGETLAEFMMGDEALKALPMSQRLATAAKSIKAIEGSPRLVKAAQIGARVLATAALHGTTAGVTQGVQTYVRNGQDAGDALTQGVETGVLAGGIGVGTGAIGELAQNAGKTAGGVKNLSGMAENAKDKAAVVQEMSDRIKASDAALHSNFETGINKLKGDLNGVTLDRTGSPVEKTAQELLQKPVPEDDPLAVDAKNISGDKLDANTKKLLQNAAMSGEAVDSATGTAPKALVLDANGNPVTSGTDLTPPTIKPHPPFDIDRLIKIRQAIRAAADNYDYGDINARVLRKLNNAVDDTIGQLAEKSGKPGALGDYQELRADYGTKLHALNDDAVIRNLRDGKATDAAQAFIGTVRANSALPSTGKAAYNLSQLTKAIGPDGVKAFGKDVFGTMLKDSRDTNGAFNPAKFAQTWQRIDEGTKNNLFDMQTATNGLQALVKDAQSGETLQHVSRAGLLATAGAIGGAFFHPIGMGLGAMLGLTVGEGGAGGMQAGRDMLNSIANHPALWSAYEKAGNVAAKGSGEIPAAIAKTAVSGYNANKQANRQALNGTQGSLGGNQ